MKNFRKGINMGKNIVFDLLVIVGGIAVIWMIGKALFKSAETDTKTYVRAAEATSDESRYSEAKDELLKELDEAIKEEVIAKNPEGFEKNFRYDITDTYLGGGVYKIDVSIIMYGYDNILLTAYYDCVEEDSIEVYTLNGTRIDESLLTDLYPELGL